MNKAILHGNCGNDAEVKTFESGKKIAKFSLATKSFRKDKDGNNITAWHNIIAWEKQAELAGKYVRKGSELIIEGEISYGSYTDKEGVIKYTTDIICNSFEFCGKKESEPQSTVRPMTKEDIMSIPDDLPY